MNVLTRGIAAVKAAVAPKPPTEREKVMAELERISKAVGGGRVSARRQAKKQIIKAYGLSPRKFKRMKKETKRVLKAAMQRADESMAAATEAAHGQGLNAPLPTSYKEVPVENTAD